MFSGSRSRLVALLDELNSLVIQVCANLAKRNTSIGNLCEFLRPKEYAVYNLEAFAEKLTHTDWEPVEYLLEHAHGWIQPPGLNL